MKALRWGILAAAVVAVVLAGVLWKSNKAHGQAVSQAFLFTWPGDDGMVGTASSAELRWSRNPIAGTDTLAWWNAATKFVGPYPVPKVAGTPDSIVVLGLPSDTVVYAVLRVADEVPNWSGFSNVASGRTKDFVPPGRVTDLRFGLLELLEPPAAFAGAFAVVGASRRVAFGDSAPPAPARLTAPPLPV